MTPTRPARAARRRARASAATPRARAAPRPRRRPPDARAGRPPPRRADAMGSVFFVAILAVGVVVAVPAGAGLLLVPFVQPALAALFVRVILGVRRGTVLQT